MMTGQSGLPDFPANDGDWDGDLGWIDRAEFERRTLAIPLIFAPGEGEEHSHWAFGMLAAIVERVSGQSYAEFLRENFFDPAGMTRTGDYGDSRGLAFIEFAAGGGVQRGLPNIPPNWGPTSWLVLGSGGMFSTLGDLRRFYVYITTSGVLEPRYTELFLSERAGLDGSDRGFELFSFSDENFSDQWVLSPTKGMLVLLHGHTWHRVRPVTGKYRVSTNYRSMPKGTPDDITDICVYRNMRYKFATSEVVEDRLQA